jgi:uroporphyrinogen-III synthase
MKRLIVTRPQPQAAAWVAQLEAAGLSAAALPLLRIEPGADSDAVERAWRSLPRFAAVVFVSPNAVTRYFAARPAGLMWPSGLLAASPGPGTDASLAAAGIPSTQRVRPRDDAVQFDSETLWAELRERDWSGREVLIVRGNGGRDWLARTMEQAGARVQVVQAYRRSAPIWDTAQELVLAQAKEQPEHHLWLLSSGEGLDHLPPADRSRWWALASHPRIAERARSLGWGQVHETRPDLASVIAAAQALQAR